MNKKEIVRFVLILLMAGSSPLVHGYSFLGQTWSGGSIVIYEQMGAPSSPLMDGTATWDAVAEGAMSSWNSHMANMKFQVVRNATTAISNGDGRNSMHWSSTIFGRSFGSSTLAVTSRLTTGSRTTEADITFNTNQSWNAYRGPLKTAAGGGWLNDVMRVSLHELGHVLGLDHPDENGQNVLAQMNSTEDDLDSLAADDIAGAQALYGYKAAVAEAAQMLSPIDGSELPQITNTFRWSAGSGVAMYQLWIGHSAGGADVFYTGNTSALAVNVTTPSDGRVLYVTLWSLIGGAWQQNAYKYTDHTAAWVHSTLSQTSNAFLGGKHTALPSSNYQNFYYYKGTDAKVWALYYGAGAWNQTALTTTANVDDWFAQSPSYNQLYYRGTDSRIYAVWYGAGKWNQVSLTATANVAGNVDIDAGTNFIYYRGTDNNLWVLWYGAGKWNQASLTSSARAAGDVAVDSIYHFAYYRGTDSHMWVVWFGAGKWNEAKLSSTANVSKNLLVDPQWGTYYQDSANGVWVVWFTGTQWAQTNLGLTTSTINGTPSLYSHLGVIYNAADGAARFIGNNGSQWTISALGPAGLNLRDAPHFDSRNGFLYSRTLGGGLGVFVYQ